MQTFPLILNAFTKPFGIDVNCLHCHASQFNGELVIGLGNAALDFTGGSGEAAGIPITDSLLTNSGLNESEIRQFRKLTDRVAIIAPDTVMRTIGNNPAEVLAITLMRHHDRDTLEWSDVLLIDYAVVNMNGIPIDKLVVKSDPPPWWRAQRNAPRFTPPCLAGTIRELWPKPIGLWRYRRIGRASRQTIRRQSRPRSVS